MNDTIETENILPFCFNQQKAHLRGEGLDHTFYFSKDNCLSSNRGSKMYNSMPSIEDFLKYIRNIPEENRHFYEQIRCERVEYYDIDGKPDENKYWENDKNVIINDFIKARQDWIKYSGFNNSELNPDTDLLILESEKLNIKKSFHIIIRNGFVFKDNVQQKKYIKSFQKYLLKTVESGLDIDPVPYSKNQNFRTVSSCKFDPNKEKRSLIRSDFNKISLECDERLFYASYIMPELNKVMKNSCISNCNTLGININKKYLKYVTGFKDEIKIILPPSIQEFSENEITTMFDHLSVKRWEDRQNCVSLIWLGKKLGLTDGDIHKYCKISKKYTYQWVNNIIENRKADDECNLTMGTLKFYLREDVDNDTYTKIVPKNTSFQDILKMKEKDRTEDQKKYMEKIFKLINKNNVKSLFTGKKKKYIKEYDINENVKYVEDLNSYWEKSRSIGIKSCMGSGKTTAAIKFISTLDRKDRIIILSPRITFSNSICAEYNEGIKRILGHDDFEKFVCYLDIKNKKRIRRENRIIISMESMHHLTELYDPDYLIIDECESNLTSHISKTNGKDLDSNIFIFKTFLQSSECKILWADAFMGEKTKQFIEDLGINTSVYNYRSKMTKRIAWEIPETDKEILKENRKIKDQNKKEMMRVTTAPWYKLLCNKLDQGKKVYFPCTTRKKVDIVEKLFRKMYPNKKGLFYTGKCKGEKQHDFSDVRKSWSECDLVMTTTTITVGINFDIPDYFNCIIMYLSSQAKNLVADMIQCHYRVRHLKDNELYFHINSRNDKLKSRSEIELGMIAKEVWYKKNYAGFDDQSPTYLKNLAINIIYEHNLATANLTCTLKYYLEECNYTVKHMDIEEIEENEEVELSSDEEDEEDDEDIRKIIKEYLKVKELTITEKRMLENDRYSRKLTDIEEKQIKKFYFIRFFDIQIDPKCLTRSQELQGIFWYFTQKKYKLMKKIAACKMEKLLISGERFLEDEAEKKFDIHSLAMLHTSDLMKTELCLDLTKSLGLDHVNDTQKNIEGEKISDMFKEYEGKYKEVFSKMDLRDRRKNKQAEFTFRNFTDLLGKVLSGSPASLCKLKVRKRKQKKVNGKMQEMKTYGLEFQEDIIEELVDNNPSLEIEMNDIPIYLYKFLGTRCESNTEHKRLLR